MFMRRRRPLAAAAMIGGTAYVANKSRSASAQSRHGRAETRKHGSRHSRRSRRSRLHRRPPPVAAAPAPAAGGDDLASQLVELKGLMDQGVLTQDEFNAAKAKLLAS